MNKFKKLLSVLLAAVMMLSCFSVMGSAYQDYAIVDDSDAYFYDSNDNPRTYLYTDEQAASAIVDMVNELLAGAGLPNMNIPVINIQVDLTSLQGVVNTLDRINGILDIADFLLGLAGQSLGILPDLDYSTVATVNYNSATGAQDTLRELFEFVYKNIDYISTHVIKTGKLDLGLIASAANLDLSGIEPILGDLPGLLGGLIYGLGSRKITNGIGSDPKYPNSPVWDDMDNTAKPNFDTMVQNLLYKLLTEPNNTMATSDASRNEIITNPTKYGATADMIHQEEGTGLYYIYGTQNADGVWAFTAASTDNEKDKQYISQWDDNSALIKGVYATQLKDIINLSNGYDLYTMLEKAIPWAYNAFGGHNLDGQLRATLMQFCGAFNNGNVDEATKEELKAEMDAYKAIEVAANGDKAALRDEFAKTQGAAGNINFMYIDLEGKKIGDRTSDSLYYVVEWGGSYQYYHVEQLDTANELFDLIDWEYQAPAWDTIAEKAGLEAGKSFLIHINDIVGTILKTAMPNLNWTDGTADDLLRDNLVSLMKVVVPAAKDEIWGESFELPADFNNYNLEQAIVMIAGILLDDLMPQLVLPEDVSSVEEVGAYALREFMAEIMPDLGKGWDDMIDAAKALSGTAREDAFLDIVLNMGTSTGAYYLKNLIGLGTITDGNNGTSTETVPMGAGYTWRAILDYIIDWVVKTFVPNLTSNVDQTIMSGDDPLLKLSAVLSKLFPSVAALIGAPGNGLALDLNVVYEDLRAVFNGDFSGLVKGEPGAADENTVGLQRKASGTAGNMKLMQALATLLTELFDGLGMEKAAEWGDLKSLMDNAANSATPLTTLLGNYGSSETISLFIEPFCECLMSDAVRPIWVSDALKIVGEFMGQTSKQSFSGFDVNGVEPSYVGASSFTIDYVASYTVSGVLTHFNNGRYMTNEGAIAGQKTGFDGTYSVKVLNSKLYNEAGAVVSTTEYNKDMTEGEEFPLSIQVSGVDQDVETYVLETSYQVTTPDGVTGEPVVNRQAFVATTAGAGSDANKLVAGPTFSYNNGWYASKGCGDAAETHLDGSWYANNTNVYISEKESLSKVEQAVFALTDISNEYFVDGTTTPQHSYNKVWVDGYGYNEPQSDGSINITDMTKPGNMVVKMDGVEVNIADTWFRWVLNEKEISTAGFTFTPKAGVYNETSPKYQMWTAATNTSRALFDADFTQYAITPKLSIHTNMADENGAVLDSDVLTATDIGTFTAYITLYNSYDLAAKMSAAAALHEDNYDLEAGKAAWDTLQAVIEEAKAQLYGDWEATKFIDEHKTKTAYEYTDENGEPATLPVGSSTFQLVAIKLDEAVAAMEEYRTSDSGEDEGTAGALAPSDPKSDLYSVYNALKTVDEKGYKSHDYVGYRWFKFSDEREAIRAALNAATPPSGVANDTLLGVDLDNAGIQGVIEAIDNDALEAIVGLLVEHPTQEAIDAAAKALADFAPVYSVEALEAQVLAMQTNERRLISKYDSQQKYFLNESITDFGNETADAYTAESYANYTAALAEAKAVNDSGSATQYEIFTARYEFQVAYNDLVRTDEAVDLSAIKPTVDTARDILSKLGTDEAYVLANDEITEEEAYKQLVSALGYEVTYNDVAYMIGGGNTAEVALKLEGLYTKAQKQDIVNAIDEALVAAVANFKAPVTAEPELLLSEYGESIGAVISTSYGTMDGFDGAVYGIDTLGVHTMDVIADCVTTPAGYIVVNTDNTNGVETTGTVIELYDDDDNLVASYVFIYFGDVDSDGFITSLDATMIADYEWTLDGIYEEYRLMAADIDGDMVQTSLDATILADYEWTLDPYAAFYMTQAEIAANYNY